MHQLLIENYEVKLTLEDVKIKNSILLTEVEELKENIFKMNLEHQENISELREELMFKMYEELYDDHNEAQKSTVPQAQNQAGQKFTEKERKLYEKKID